MYIAAALLLIGAVIAARFVMKRRRRNALLSSPLSAERRRILHQKMPIYAGLPADLRDNLDGLVNRFLDEVKFFGYEDVEITDEVRVTIAAQACMLLINKPNRWFSSLRTIHVYPTTFGSRISHIEGHVHSERRQTRSGESWAKGPVVLAWDHAAYGAFVPHDGQNVVMHEFAHQLDEQTGVSDGSPLLDEGQSASRWARVFRAAYRQLQADAVNGAANVLDAYGATKPAEFFAVATETFFERPNDLRAQEPELYDELSQYYRVDPAIWR